MESHMQAKHFDVYVVFFFFLTVDMRHLHVLLLPSRR